MKLYVLSATRLIADTPIGNLPLREHQRLICGSGALEWHPAAWLAENDVHRFLSGGCSVLTDMHDRPIVWLAGKTDGERERAEDSFLITEPWDLLHANERYVASMFETKILGSVHVSAVIEGTIHLGEGSRILPGVYIEGNVVIGRDCKIGPNCYLRGNTSIGDNCHIGQSVEIKNSLILSKTNIGHLSYVGDSVLGEGVNFGAGTVVSNLRHDGANHRSLSNGILVDTGRRKLGTIVGDGVHTGINTSIYPGRKLWPGMSTRPGDIVNHDLITISTN